VGGRWHNVYMWGYFEKQICYPRVLLFHIKCKWGDKHWQLIIDKCGCVVHEYLAS